MASRRGCRTTLCDQSLERRQGFCGLGHQSRYGLTVLGNLERFAGLDPPEIDGQVLAELSDADPGWVIAMSFGHVAHGSTSFPMAAIRLQSYRRL